MKENKIGNLLESALPRLNFYFVLTGFLAAFGLFFIRPIFFDPGHIMQFPIYLPAADSIGVDLQQMLSYCVSFFVHNRTPYIGQNLYPPLATVIFSPFLLLDGFTAYQVITVINVCAYILTAFIIPMLVIKHKGESSIILLLFITGLFSYGFHFELERGQFNIIAFSFSMLAVYLYHYKPRLRLLSYILLTLSIQLKVYPAVFIIMLVDNWADWQNNLKRFAGIILLNFSLLFVLGYQVFQDFIKAISAQALNPGMSMVNHSINIFVELLSRKIGFRSYFLANGMDLNQVKALAGYAPLIRNMLVISVLVCLLIIILRAIKLKTPGLNPYLLLACTLIALLIPPLSLDYKLPLVAGPLAILLQQNAPYKRGAGITLTLLLLGLISSFAYSTTLISYINKPLVLNNNLPALLVILFAVTAMSMLAGEKPNSKHPSAI